MADEQAAFTWPELMAATSLAADAGMSLPLETDLATCLVSVALGRTLQLGEDELTRTYHGPSPDPAGPGTRIRQVRLAPGY